MTALALLLPILALGGPAAAAVARPKAVAESLTLDNGLDKGKWGPIDICTTGSYAFGFEIKYSGEGFLDRTSVNGIRLYCQMPDGTVTNHPTSSEGAYGQWMDMRKCPAKEFFTGVRANVVPGAGLLGDQIGVDNLQMECSGGDIFDGQHGNPPKNPVVTRKMTRIGDREVEAVHMKIRQSADTRDLGDWGTWRKCSAENKVCGLQVRLDNDNLLDDAGVTDVTMYCCD